MGNTIPTYKDPYEEKLKGYLQQIEERKPFQYDVGSDALYQQLRDNYEQQGKLAMEDTMGKASAMTGGYGNSYAQSVGQQVYNQHMQQLNDTVPDLYGMALDRYQQEGQELQGKYDFYKGLSDESYNKYLLENGLMTGNNGANPIEYTTLDGETEKAFIRDFESAASPKEVEWIGDRMEARGIDPNIVAMYVNKYLERFAPAPIIENHVTGGRGGGGGRYLTTPY